MKSSPSFRALALGLTTLAMTALTSFAQSPAGVRDYLGPQFSSQPNAPKKNAAAKGNPVEVLRHWNATAVDASGLDHTPVAPGDPRIFGEQLGPARAARAMAIVHIAMFEAANAFEGKYRFYTHNFRAPAGASMDAAIAQAAHDTLVAMFPSQKTTFDDTLTAELAGISSVKARNKGVSLGQSVAASILALRSGDGSDQTEPRLGVQFFPLSGAGYWRQDPVSMSPVALGANWGLVRPFVIQSAMQFRAPAPPALNSPEYTAAYNEAKDYGAEVSSSRTADQTEIGTFWAYDGTPSLCAPPRLYNQITMHIADQMHTTAKPAELARLLAIANVSMADAAIAIWESKYYYQFWRPVGGIREDDGNPDTVADPNFMPAGAPASNLTGPNFTPPFPSYPSGHGGFGGALFETLRNFYGRDDVAFTFTSDEFNGVTVDNAGHTRPLRPRSFASFSQAEEENGQSRIYLGIHWSFDKTAAIAQGRKVADYVFTHAFTPVPRGRGH